MTMNQSEKVQPGIVLALCFAALGMASDSVVIPMVTAIEGAFPDAGLFWRNMVITGASLAAIPSSLLAAVLSRYISQKKLLIVSLSLFCLGGCLAAFSPNIYFLTAMRVLDGASDGILTVTVCSLISQLYKEEEIQSRLLGWHNAAASLFGVVVSIFSGFLVQISWRLSFLLNGFTVINLLLVIRYIPELPLLGEKPKSDLDKYRRTFKPEPVFWVLAGALASFIVIGVAFGQIYLSYRCNHIRTLPGYFCIVRVNVLGYVGYHSGIFLLFWPYLR